MDRAGHEFLARSGFAGNEYCGIGRCGLGDSRKDRLQSRRGSDDFLEHRSLVDLLAEREILILHSLFCLFQSFDFSTSHEPTKDASVTVQKRVEAMQKPAIGAVLPLHSCFEFELHSAGAVLARARHFVPIVRMHHCLIKAWFQKLLEGAAKIVKGRSVGVYAASIGLADNDELWNVVNDVAKLLLGSLQFLDICIHSEPSNDGAMLVAKWFGAEQEPPIFAVEPPQARFFFARCSGS